MNHRHQYAHPKGGFNLSSDPIQNAQVQAANIEMVKRLGSSIYNGQSCNVFKIRKPILLCQDFTLLQAIANENVFCNEYLIKESQNEIDQIQNVLCYFLAGFSVNLTKILCKSPLEPISGETLQLIKQDGTQFYGECISDDSIRYQIINDRFTIIGNYTMQMYLSKTLNTLYGYQKGSNKIIFKDGNHYQVQLPNCTITGIMLGDRIFNLSDKLTIECEQSKLKLELVFESEQSSMSSKLWGMFGGNNQKEVIPDRFKISIFKQNLDQQVLLLEGQGSWLEQLTISNKQLWTIHQTNDLWQSSSLLLPSDSSLRLDLKHLKLQNIQQAQHHKNLLDRQENQDRQLRKQ